MPQGPLVYRQRLLTRITHWIWAVSLFFLMLTGLQIFNAHPALYWGGKSTFAQPWLSMTKQEIDGAPHGITTLGGLRFDTTGLFGWSGKEVDQFTGQLTMTPVASKD